MISRIACLFICILISRPAPGQDVLPLLMEESEYALARLELYKRYQGPDSLQHPKVLAAIAYTYQLEDQHLKAKALYRRAIQGSAELPESYVDSLKSNLCYSLIELNEFGTAYGLFSGLENEHILPIKKRFFILTAERQNPLSKAVFDADEISAFNSFSASLKNPRHAAWMSALLPGLGQFYADHPIDAAQAFMVVGAGALYSAVAFQAFDHNETGPGLTVFTVGVTALFHYANILSGKRTAIYRNMKLKQDYLVQTGLDRSLLDLSRDLPEQPIFTKYESLWSLP